MAERTWQIKVISTLSWMWAVSRERERERRLNEWTDTTTERDIPGFCWSLNVDARCACDPILFDECRLLTLYEHSIIDQIKRFRYKMQSWPNSFHPRVACSLGKFLRKKEGKVSCQGGGCGAGPEGGHWFGEGQRGGKSLWTGRRRPRKGQGVRKLENQAV